MTDTQELRHTYALCGIYAKYIKRLLDFFLSLLAITVLSPLLLILAILGLFLMKGNPFFVQPRPGKINPKTGQEKIFKLIKFRTMTCQKDETGKLLPDMQRLTGYGKFLRSSSLDELPELFNILKGDMAIVGPRPLMARYLPYYTERERMRHLVRPGLTGYAQIHGRNAVSWDERFEFDLQYVENITFHGDVKIIIDTVAVILKREGINIEDLQNLDDYRQEQLKSADRNLVK